MEREYKKVFIAVLIIACPLILLLCLSARLGIPSLFIHTKTILSLGFVVLALFMSYLRKELDRLSLFCLTALVFGLLGDIFLELINKLENVGILSGLLFFLCEHIVWCAGMLVCGRNSPNKKRLLFTMPLSVLGVTLFVICLVSLVGAELGTMTVPVFVYGIILTFAFVIPFSLMEKRDIRLLLLGIAGILFFISDALLIKGLFGGGSSDLTSVLNLLTYYYAQFLIALSTGIRTPDDSHH